jgi:hypothetical protein
MRTAGLGAPRFLFADGILAAAPFANGTWENTRERGWTSPPATDAGEREEAGSHVCSVEPESGGTTA